MTITENARKVLEARYLIKDENGQPAETIEQLFDRVATAIAAEDAKYGDSDSETTKHTFYQMMTRLEFLPNSPTLMNAGRPLGQLSACFVLPVADTMEDIFEAIKQAALIHKSGGGTGFSFSRLRPRGSAVNSTGGVASGPVSFMKVFNMATEAVKQGGTRRGANMGILRVDHPDILEFISCKQDNADINNFNISVGVTETFMRAVINDETYELIDPRTQKTTQVLPAKEVFDKIVDAAWHNGEPGIIFLDRLNRDNPVPGCGQIESTNPCGEQPLLPYESCNLGSINLTKMLKFVDDKYIVDWDKLTITVHNAVHFLDNVIDANKYPLPIIDETTKKTRKIGLGIMAFADMLLLMNISYCSEEALELAEKIMRCIQTSAREAGARLARIRGAFPLFAESILAAGDRRRNATLTTIAPTGALSIIAGVSSGIEPVFAYVFERNVMDGTRLYETNPILEQELIRRGLHSEELMQRLASGESLDDMPELPAEFRRVFVSSRGVTPEWHIRMQAAFQKYTDNAISKTVNFSNNATRDDVREVYMLAFALECKGVTIYRDGSRDSQVLNAAPPQKEQTAESLSLEPMPASPALDSNIKSLQPSGLIKPRPRPDLTTGITERMKIGCGNLYVTVNYDDEGICEVFTNTGKAGGCPSQSEATARLISIALRSGMDARSLISELKGIRCPSTIRQQGMKCMSCPDGIARIIENVFTKHQNGLAAQDPRFPPNGILAKNKDPGTCPDCGIKVEHEGGCVTCRSCGYSRCG
ncbi:MAG: vitamin B12-dependent ribonucleotide reductase [Peptococcaceae bacterium]|nr:vitamin B12-dependent ribonucleotide reductase [Peptococcaceae bacterium]